MGLFDFLSNDGEKKPVAPAPKPAAGGATDFFGNANQPAAQPAAAQADKYTVVSGDSLSKIAKNHYGDASKWHQIYDANKATIGANPDHIEVGQVLTLPKI
ncbi:LysM peptidoglycan-binding domain-containing protein [Hymenobacter sp. 5516J-16]|uniref:LysM peptidoglycan-binding domain-containing protein n=1 Tax=Hymenobacter sublimis TaxID=2933777 RepID=A0ABY4J9F7_9BACT|nr:MULTISPECIES: LysM peptidoglycan-binding domain-containing protein [Hymenobacter]UOQ78619.1 LysM peptidoglycan-binding domain-containing protein [Hymenobacter sp. 5516J-16]UPL48603.1 LysM peptidoglycan-binding domain-containing protein [Hymenobacter sublimis]